MESENGLGWKDLKYIQFHPCHGQGTFHWPGLLHPAWPGISAVSDPDWLFLAVQRTIRLLTRN